MSRTAGEALMCGRYAASVDPDALIEVFEIDNNAMADPTRSLLVKPQDPVPGALDYNMAPSKAAPVVVARDGSRQLRLLSWGLVPSWAKDTRGGARMINARAETLLTKPAYRRAARTRRALVPAQGWYEWQVSPTAKTTAGTPGKQPFFTSRADAAPVAMAGIYEFWKDPSVGPGVAETPWVVTFAIITQPAERGLDRIHERQPLVLDHDRWDRWLDPSLADDGEISALLGASEPGRFTTAPVGTAVNRVSNNGPELLAELGQHDLVGVVDPSTGEVLG